LLLQELGYRVRERVLSATEAVAGLLLFAWSTSVLFHHTSWVTEARHNDLREQGLFGRPPIPMV
jgi:hypothetical protein